MPSTLRKARVFFLESRLVSIARCRSVDSFDRSRFGLRMVFGIRIRRQAPECEERPAPRPLTRTHAHENEMRFLCRPNAASGAHSPGPLPVAPNPGIVDPPRDPPRVSARRRDHARPPRPSARGAALVVRDRFVGRVERVGRSRGDGALQRGGRRGTPRSDAVHARERPRGGLLRGGKQGRGHERPVRADGDAPREPGDGKKEVFAAVSARGVRVLAGVRGVPARAGRDGVGVHGRRGPRPRRAVRKRVDSAGGRQVDARPRGARAGEGRERLVREVARWKRAGVGRVLV